LLWKLETLLSEPSTWDRVGAREARREDELENGRDRMDVIGFEDASLASCCAAWGGIFVGVGVVVRKR